MDNKINSQQKKSKPQFSPQFYLFWGISVAMTALLLGGFGYYLYQIRLDRIARTQPVQAEASTNDNESNNSNVQSLKASDLVLVEQKITAPDISELKDDDFGKSVKRGKLYVEDTYRQLPKHVGSKLNCTNCHLAGGTTPNAGPWVGIIGEFPQYRSRTGKMDALTDRINDCFERSLNGKPLPASSNEMTDIVTYMTWLSKGYVNKAKLTGRGMPKLVLEREPNLELGQKVFLNKCASCHQANGQGFVGTDGKYTYPPLWGPKSFNIGAGMARLHTAAGFVKHNMPLGMGGSLTDDEAWDVAFYFSQQDRPDFLDKKNDWPKGGRPKDARYQ